jgi:hypothetical protein
MDGTRGARLWYDLAGKQFRLLSQGRTVVSEPISFSDVNVELTFTAKSDASSAARKIATSSAITNLGSVEFLVTGAAESGTGVVLGASRLTLLERQPKQMKDFMRVVAGILAARLAPPANQYCEFCKRSAVNK